MDDLSSKTTKELRQLLKELGAPAVRGQASVATLVKAVKAAQNHEVDQTPTDVAPQAETESHKLSEYVALPESIKPPAAMPFAVGHSAQPGKRNLGCSQEQVLEAVKNFTAKGMTVKFIDNCFEFRLKDRVDSGNMAQPIDAIRKCAELVCRYAVPATQAFLNKGIA